MALLLPQRSAWAEAYQCVSFEYPPLITQRWGGAPRRPASRSNWSSACSASWGPASRSSSIPGNAMAKVRLGEADCIFTIYRYPDRELFLDYSEQLVAAQIIYFYAQGRECCLQRQSGSAQGPAGRGGPPDQLRSALRASPACAGDRHGCRYRHEFSQTGS
ncbi:hypothetical protein LP420_02800 [Massilia sp. B-10]|nr:hypothetical protein LP420_02800 [Massilia sp. B-10]